MKIKSPHAALLITVFLMTACSTGPSMQMENYSEPVFSAERILPKDYNDRSASNVYDP